MTTLQQGWQDYRNKVYPKTISPIQNKECHQAFFAGALTTILLMHQAGQLPDAQAESALARLQAEAQQACQGIADRAQARN